MSRDYSSLQHAGFSLRSLLLLQCMGSRCTGSVVAVCGLSSCGSQALERRLSSCGAQALLLCGMWDLPGPGLEPMCPALAGGFLTTAPPGKSSKVSDEQSADNLLEDLLYVTSHFFLAAFKILSLSLALTV